MGKSLTESLSKYLSESSSFDNPFQEEETSRVNTDSFIKEQEGRKREKKKSKRKKDKLEILLDTEEELERDLFYPDDNVNEFESYIEDMIVEDDDSEFRRELVKRGRQYARETAVSKESSEIQKVYAGNEQRIEKLLQEVETDNELLGKDIMQMRSFRSKNYKALAEMIGERRSLHDTTLSAIKELNNMNKAKIELQMKADKQKQEEGGDGELIASRAIQNVFGMGRSSFMNSYEDMSGSLEAGESEEVTSYDEDEIIHKKYFNNDDDIEDDGDKFLKYEGMSVHYVLEYDDDGPVQILAEDRDGNVIPDYPIPDLSDDMDFTISENTGTATDSLSQKYILRKI